jgi:two-component system, OmpR family, response regulator BasR
MYATSSVAVNLRPKGPRERNVARVLLADSELASRLTLETLLSTAGYAVDCAASASEAIAHLNACEYQLVLADLRTESGEAGARLLAYARQKDFHPATALISSRMSEMDSGMCDVYSTESVVRMSDANVSYLLARVAELIGDRADRRIQRSLRRAS